MNQKKSKVNIQQNPTPYNENNKNDIYHQKMTQDLSTMAAKYVVGYIVYIFFIIVRYMVYIYNTLLKLLIKHIGK